MALEANSSCEFWSSCARNTNTHTHTRTPTKIFKFDFFFKSLPFNLILKGTFLIFFFKFENFCCAGFLLNVCFPDFGVDVCSLDWWG